MDCYKKQDFLGEQHGGRSANDDDYKQLSGEKQFQNMQLKQYVQWRQESQHTNIYDADNIEIKTFSV